MACGCAAKASRASAGEVECRETKDTFTSPGDVVVTTTHKYDSKGARVKSRVEFSTGARGTTEYTQDKNGFLVGE